MNNINNFYILSLWNLFETEIVANGALLPFQNLLSINKFWENGEVFLNFSTFCWYSDFLSIVSLRHIESFYFWNTLKYLITPAFLSQSEVYYKLQGRKTSNWSYCSTKFYNCSMGFKENNSIVSNYRKV